MPAESKSGILASAESEALGRCRFRTYGVEILHSGPISFLEVFFMRRTNSNHSEIISEGPRDDLHRSHLRYPWMQSEDGEQHTKGASLRYATWFLVGCTQSSTNSVVVLDLLMEARVGCEDALGETPSL